MNIINSSIVTVYKQTLCVWGVLCWVLVLWCSSCCPFCFSNHLSEEERAGCLILTVFWLSVLCLYVTILCVGLQCVIVAFPGYKPYLVSVQFTIFLTFFYTRVYAV